MIKELAPLTSFELIHTYGFWKLISLMYIPFILILLGIFTINKLQRR
ncbi:MAG: hypothetical protein ACRC18_06380 [Cetobacterium sp.]